MSNNNEPSPASSRIQFQWISREEESKKFRSVTQKIKNRFDSMCKDMIRRSYFTKTMLPHADYIVVAERPRSSSHNTRRRREKPNTQTDKPSMDIDGFMLVQQKEEDILFIDLLCARGVGKALLNHAVQYAKEHNIGFITLHAIPYVINYYRNFGFRINKNPRACSDDKRVAKLYGPKTEKKKFATIDESLQDKAFVSVIRKLMDLKINVKDDKDFEEKLTHGFPMVLCVKSKKD